MIKRDLIAFVFGVVFCACAAVAQPSLPSTFKAGRVAGPGGADIFVRFAGSGPVGVVVQITGVGPSSTRYIDPPRIRGVVQGRGTPA
jgi:hypothetical protein